VTVEEANKVQLSAEDQQGAEAAYQSDNVM